MLEGGRVLLVLLPHINSLVSVVVVRLWKLGRAPPAVPGMLCWNDLAIGAAAWPSLAVLFGDVNNTQIGYKVGCIISDMKFYYFRFSVILASTNSD